MWGTFNSILVGEEGELYGIWWVIGFPTNNRHDSKWGHRVSIGWRKENTNFLKAVGHLSDHWYWWALGSCVLAYRGGPVHSPIFNDWIRRWALCWHELQEVDWFGKQFILSVRKKIIFPLHPAWYFGQEGRTKEEVTLLLYANIRHNALDCQLYTWPGGMTWKKLLPQRQPEERSIYDSFDYLSSDIGKIEGAPKGNKTFKLSVSGVFSVPDEFCQCLIWEQSARGCRGGWDIYTRCLFLEGLMLRDVLMNPFGFISLKGGRNILLHAFH